MYFRTKDNRVVGCLESGDLEDLERGFAPPLPICIEYEVHWKEVDIGIDEPEYTYEPIALARNGFDISWCHSTSICLIDYAEAVEESLEPIDPSDYL